MNKILLFIFFICFTTSVFSQMVGYQPRAFLPTRFVIDDRPASIGSVINIMETDSKQQKLMRTSVGMKNVSSFMLIGGTALMGSTIVLDFNNKLTRKRRVFIAGLGMGLLSIPLVGISNNKAGRSIDLHNASINALGNKIQPEWRLNFSNDGIGVAYMW